MQSKTNTTTKKLGTDTIDSPSSNQANTKEETSLIPYTDNMSSTKSQSRNKSYPTKTKVSNTSDNTQHDQQPSTDTDNKSSTGHVNNSNQQNKKKSSLK